MKPLPLNESDRGNTLNTSSNSRSDTPPRLRCQRRKPYLPSINHESSTVPSSRCHRCRPQFTSAPGIPPKLHTGVRANAVATMEPEDTGHHEDAAAATPSLVEQTSFQIHPQPEDRWPRQRRIRRIFIQHCHRRRRSQDNEQPKN